LYATLHQSVFRFLVDLVLLCKCGSAPSEAKASPVAHADSGQDFYTVKYDTNGNTLWDQRYDNGSSDRPADIVVDSAGNAYVTGYSWSSNADYLTIKYDPDGNVVWTRRYASANGHDEPLALAVDANGNVYVTGDTEGNFVNYDYYTIKYNSNGDVAWERRYDDENHSSDFATGIAVDPLGNVYVTGLSYTGSAWEYCTMKYDPDGQLLWQQFIYSGSDETLPHMALDSGANIHIAGNSSQDFLTVKYDSDGNLLWQQTYDGGLDDLTTGIQTDSAGNSYVTGYSAGAGTGFDFYTIKYDANGEMVWQQRYNNDSANLDDWAQAIAVDNNGNAYVTGAVSDPNLNQSFYTIRYDANGGVGWQDQLTIPGYTDDFACCIALDSDGNVIVSGNSLGFLTAKSDAAGNVLWKRLDNSSASGQFDLIRNMKVDPAGNIYLTGLTYEIATRSEE
jgi:uncharacterized delta-60 repeat protein